MRPTNLLNIKWAAITSGKILAGSWSSGCTYQIANIFISYEKIPAELGLSVVGWWHFDNTEWRVIKWLRLPQARRWPWSTDGDNKGIFFYLLLSFTHFTLGRQGPSFMDLQTWHELDKQRLCAQFPFSIEFIKLRQPSLSFSATKIILYKPTFHPHIEKGNTKPFSFIKEINLIK